MRKIVSTNLKKFTQSIIYHRFSTLLKSCQVINSDEKFHADLLILNGKIDRIFRKKPQTIIDHPFEGLNVIDVEGKFVFPGGIDTHTHLQLPFMGETTADDFNIGSKAAIAGGTTCFIDFVIPSNEETLLEAFEKWRSWADPKVNCDYSLHVAINKWKGKEIMRPQMEEIVRKGVTSFKIYMAYKDVLLIKDEELLEILEVCKELGAICMVHAENGELIYSAQQKLLKLGVKGPEGHALSRPPAFEAEAVHRAITIADFVNTPLYIVHVMSDEASEEVVRYRNKGNLLFAETLAAGLGTDGKALFDKDWEVAAGHVMSPLLSLNPQTKTNLMKLLQSDGLQVVSTDNCTFCRRQKKVGLNDFTKIPNGINGIEDRMAVVWTKGVKTGLLSHSDFVRVTSTNAAKIFNLYPKKGIIREGADADLVVWDGEKERIISRHTHHQAVDFNVFEGMKVNGINEMTMVGGKIVWQKEKFTEEMKPGLGKFVARTPFGYPFERIDELDRARDPRKFIVDREEKIGDGQINMELKALKEENLVLKKKLEDLQNQNRTENNTLFNDGEIISIEKCLGTIEQGKILDETMRILYGRQPIELNICSEAKKMAKDNNFDLQGYVFHAKKEENRPERRVKICAIQNKIVLPTTAPVKDQIKAIHERVN